VVDGDFYLPIIFLGYNDTTVTTNVTPVIGDTAQFRAVLFSANPQGEAVPLPYSLKTYYEQTSNGRLAMHGDLYGWINTPFSYDFIGNNCAAVFCAGFTTRFGAMLRAGLDSLNGVNGAPQVDWGQYDNDGPDGVPNSGDDNGIVDFVTFVHPTLGGECGGAGGGSGGDRIWAHRWTLQSVSGSMYTTNTPRTGGGTNIRINDYTVQSARGGSSSCNPNGPMPVGTVAHETGHAFGIPDLYDTKPNLSDVGEGIGEWGLMGSANYTTPFSPGGFDAWSQMELGWVNVDTLTTSRNVTLNPVQTSDTVLVAPISGTDEYIIFENRANLHSDTAQMRVGFSRRKLPGLLIWHIDQSVITAGRTSNQVNAGAVEGVRLIQADGLGELQSGTDRGDVGDSYPGSTNNTRWTYTTNPAARNNDAANAGFVIDSIVQVSDIGAITFRFRRSAPWRGTTAAFAAGALLTVNGVTNTSFEDIFGLGDSINVSVADSQTVAAGRTRLVFLNWSDAGARVHTIISDGTPDTVTANFTTRHRINFVANGSGTVGTSGPATNTFVDQGNAVTLTATPTGGATFTNWTGDTTTANASLVLPMGRPYSVTANFSGAVAVSYAQATNAILGIAALTGPQATYLDDVGNNNGIYDLGDYLAYLKANAIVVAPGILKRIESGRGLAPRMEQ
jgi:M6 family metalloprotease-like protein